MIAIAITFALVWYWERTNLARWGAGERAAFWVAWVLMLAWAVAVETHLRLPDLPELTDPLFRSVYRTYLRRRPDMYW